MIFIWNNHSFVCKQKNGIQYKNCALRNVLYEIVLYRQKKPKAGVWAEILSKVFTICALVTLPKTPKTTILQFSPPAVNTKNNDSSIFSSSSNLLQYHGHIALFFFFFFLTLIYLRWYCFLKRECFRIRNLSEWSY